MKRLISTGAIQALFLLLPFLFPFILAAQNPCAVDSSLHIVVLGSSTAAGAGASPFDSAWVNLYRDHLQTINPNYQVSNLARGGYSTYWLMPDDFVPPNNRPSPDSTRNISEAISLSPDGIIINLPSNDVSSGYSVAEQLSNFEVIVSTAQNANIPIWVCTTQPKNYNGNSIPIQKQLDVRDSLTARYSPYVLDFWSGLADNTNQIDPFYDSGDGTHLNNAGHYLLFSRARDADLPEQLLETPDFIDYSIFDFKNSIAPDCGTSSSQYVLSIINRGLDDTQAIPVELIVKNQNASWSLLFRDTLKNGLLHCEQEDLIFNINSSIAGEYLFNISINAPIDGDTFNNVLSFSDFFVGIPLLEGIGSTICEDNSTTLLANAAPGDSIRWYDAPTNGMLVGTGPSFQTPLLSESTSYYAEAVRGNFQENNSLVANDLFDRDWNGIMFDLQADVDLALDSFEIKVDTFGQHLVDIYTRQGSHLGYELDATAWDYLGAIPINVSSPTAWTAIALNGLTMEAGDSLAIYMQLQNPVNTLFYLAVPEPITRSTDDLTLFSGSGISHDFSELYYPRDWNGRIYYQISKPDGDCSTGLIKVEAIVSEPIIDLGQDTILSETASVLLEVDPGFSVVEWSDGSTGQSLLVDGTVLGLGVFEFSVIVEDAFSCLAYDTLQVTFTPSVMTQNPLTFAIHVWPNPVDDILYIDGLEGDGQFIFWDQWGRKILDQAYRCKSDCVQKIDVVDLETGIYFLELKTDNGGRFFQKVMIH